VLAAVAGSIAQLDEGLVVAAGEVEEVLSRLLGRGYGVVLPDRGAELRSLGRRWSASTAAMEAQAIAFAGADRFGPTSPNPSQGANIATRNGPESVQQPKRDSREMGALTTLFNRFEDFDTATDTDRSKPDNRVSLADLEAASQRGGDVGSAARWILAQPGLVGFLDTGSSNTDYLDKVEEGRFYARGGDGEISVEDVIAYVEKREINRILGEVADRIDVAARGGIADGVLSRADYEAFVRSGDATDVQVLAISIALQQGAVDGEQGVASDVADLAATIADISGKTSAVLAFSAVVMASTGVLAPAAGLTASAAGALGAVSLAASAVEGTAGLIAGDEDHIIAAGVGLVTFGAGRGASSVIRGATTPTARIVGGSSDEILDGMLESTLMGRTMAELAESAIGTLGDTTVDAIAESAKEPKISLGTFP